MKFEDYALLGLAFHRRRRFFFGIGVHQERHDGAVHAGGRFDDVWSHVLLGLFVKIAEGLSTRLGMRHQVIVGAVGYALNLAPTPRILVLDVESPLGVVGQLVLLVLTEAEPRRIEAQPGVPAHARLDPLIVRPFIVARLYEVLDLHDLELACAEYEPASRYLIAERLADLADAERQLAPGRGRHVLEVDEDALSGLGTEVHYVLVGLNRSDVGLEHEVEHAGVRQRAGRGVTCRTREARHRNVSCHAHVYDAFVLFARSLCEGDAPILQLFAHFRHDVFDYGNFSENVTVDGHCV